MRENTSVHRLLRRALSLCLAVVLTVSLCVPALAANGDQENGGVVGVAPDAQIFGLKAARIKMSDPSLIPPRIPPAS